jgi:hypothetical protein
LIPLKSLRQLHHRTVIGQEKPDKSTATGHGHGEYGKCDAPFVEMTMTALKTQGTLKTDVPSVADATVTTANDASLPTNASKVFSKSVNGTAPAKTLAAQKSNAASHKLAGNERLNPKISSKWQSISKSMY